MITEVDVKNLVTQVNGGRGLWVGLFLPQAIDARTTSTEMAKHTMREFLPQDAHVTLTHLGKDVSEDTVSKACEIATHFMSRGKWALQAELTGYGCFWHHRGIATSVALVNSAAMCELQHVMRGRMIDQRILRESQYGFIPHISLITNDSTLLAQRCLGERPLRVYFPCISVVCGDVRADAS